MNGPTRKFDYARYYRQLEVMPEPIKASELPKVKLNLKGVRQYAREKGVSIVSLTDAEKNFLWSHEKGVDKSFQMPRMQNKIF